MAKTSSPSDLLAPTPAALALDEAAIKRATMDHNLLACPGIGEIDRLVTARGRELAEAAAKETDHETE